MKGNPVATAPGSVFVLHPNARLRALLSKSMTNEKCQMIYGKSDVEPLTRQFSLPPKESDDLSSHGPLKLQPNDLAAEHW